RRGYFSEYRYDALGRRVLVRTRRDGLCHASSANSSTVDCTSGIERYVWAGDNVLWELRGPGSNTATAAQLEQESTTGQEYGIVGYTHAGGVDRPLVAYKTAGGNAGAVVVPHMNWRGLFSMGTNSSGGASTTPVEWPGFRTTANHSMGETQAITKNWMGSLLEGQRDAGGLMYMRNRYYDPKTGQFTQMDPIGLAGGVNTYGFAEGDPISYSDPYGLSSEEYDCPPCGGGNDASPRQIEREVARAKFGASLATREGWPRRVVPTRSRSAQTANPLEGTRYTGKVRQQMRPQSIRRQTARGEPYYDAETDNHGFPLQVDNMARYGTTRTITGGDGVQRTMVELRGEYKGNKGTFEWIVEPDRTINHRYFRKDP
ncbi:RHS repeat-associated core domain-containing protein, partial [Longimicrobium sp.]|uniref:RHS repeat-associated core domain-containing protein n=1 Tax=Longimicrobium sp. TaxID=2029185 RepID=UPI003B3B83B2